jgi:hypothetical protein
MHQKNTAARAAGDNYLICQINYKVALWLSFQAIITIPAGDHLLFFRHGLKAGDDIEQFFIN